MARFMFVGGYANNNAGVALKVRVRPSSGLVLFSLRQAHRRCLLRVAYHMHTHHTCPTPAPPPLKSASLILRVPASRCVLSLLAQGHLFEGWPEAGTSDDSKRSLMDQSIGLDAKYPGGLEAYVTKVIFFCYLHVKHHNKSKANRAMTYATVGIVCTRGTLICEW